ncbi:MAG: hypothetical protein LUD78_10950 [Clostridiales bacterium]|nr:hypothetical protein [Clostridiales bacterium]
MTWDKQAEKPLLRCCICGGEIYRGERYYIVGGEAACEACVREEVADDEEAE